MRPSQHAEVLERELFPPLRRGAVAVAASNRLARRILVRYGQWRQASGAVAWQRPQVLSWQEWLRGLWEESLLRGGRAGGSALLSKHGSLLLWERALRSDRRGQLDIGQNAALARRSWNRALDYGLNLETLCAEVEGRDERRFAGWVRRFEQLRIEGGWLEPAALPQALAEDAQAGAIAARSPIWLLGMDEPLPAPHRLLLDCLRQSGAAIAAAPATPRPQHVWRADYDDGAAELEAAADWAGSGNAGVVVLDFGERAGHARRALLNRMQPAWQTRGFPLDAPLNSAEAPSLGHAGPPAAALDALQMLPARIDFEALSRTLRGAYLAGARRESGGRARLERSIRADLVGGEITRTQLMARAGRRAPEFSEALRQGWSAARKARGKGKRHSHRTWAAAFASFLRELGWPGNRSLDSGEKQAEDAWNKLLTDFAGCDAVAARPVSLNMALSRLKTMLADRQFQPQGPDAAVELLPAGEAAGMHFDRLWVAGASASLWPRPIRPLPFLPLRLQRGLQMPQASPQAALEQARRQTQALMHCACEVVFSWAQLTDEGVAAICSPLIADIPRISRDVVEAGGESSLHYAESLRCKVELEVLNEEPPPLGADEEIRGGTNLMDRQLSNPFRAFAEYRLHAREYPRPRDGIGPLLRGNLIHKLLHRLYSEYGDAASLRAATPDLPARLEEWAREIPRDEPLGFRPLVLALLRLERERAAELALQWTRHDLRRGSFQVERLEEKVELKLGLITLAMRLDRVDRLLPDGERLVLDYKTGSQPPRLTGLDPGKRFESSQLPAYALATGKVAGVGYVHLSGRPLTVPGRYDPAAADSGIGQLPNMKPLSGKWPAGWQGQLDFWRRELENAAQQLSRGDARIEIPASDRAGADQYQVLSRTQELQRDSG